MNRPTMQIKNPWVRIYHAALSPKRLLHSIFWKLKPFWQPFQKKQKHNFSVIGLTRQFPLGSSTAAREWGRKEREGKGGHEDAKVCSADGRTPGGSAALSLNEHRHVQLIAKPDKVWRSSPWFSALWMRHVICSVDESVLKSDIKVPNPSGLFILKAWTINLKHPYPQSCSVQVCNGASWDVVLVRV